MKKSIAGFDVRQKCILQALTLSCTSNQTSNVHDIEPSRNFTSWLVKINKKVVSFIRDCNTTFIWINCTEREIFSRYSTLGYDVEKCGFPDVWQTHNANLKVCTVHSTHNYMLLLFYFFLWRHFG